MNVQEIDLSAQNLVKKLLTISETETVCLLDSCGVSHLSSHLLIAGIEPIETIEINENNSHNSLKFFSEQINKKATASFFTISYDFGLKLENIKKKPKKIQNFKEPDIFLANFDCLIIHDYKSEKTFLKGNPLRFEKIEKLLHQTECFEPKEILQVSKTESNFTKDEYIFSINKIKELIRDGETYQTNLTQQFKADLPVNLSPQQIFYSMRNDHPAPFASFIKRKNDYVLSISPERFIRIENNAEQNTRIIKTSPIKGTRPRSENSEIDSSFRNELIMSQKDRAENTMIVDLLRNDLGRICEFGSVKVEKLCDLEEHPTIFHLVSTVSGTLKNSVDFAEVIKATFPCGSITGCPKIRTMQIIDEIETVDRGLSMGGIGYCDFDNSFDMSVAIRTLVVQEEQAIFNVGGGIVIDSDPVEEYEESLLKAKAIFLAIGAK